MSKKGALPSDWLQIMGAEEKRTGLPAGTLLSLVQQETGLQQRFIDDPGAVHYTGSKPKSSARGLGGILAGTARDPGYGVTPLKDWSVPEQLRFMADYAVARSKQAGSLEAGLAAYGEGSGYAKQVLSRVGKQDPTQPPVVVASQEASPVVNVPPPMTVNFENGITQAYVRPDIQAPAGYVMPKFKAPSMGEMSSLMSNGVVPNFNTFGKWGKFEAKV